MSLFETFYEPAVVMDKTKSSDGVGGIINKWAEGEAISVAFSGLSPLERVAAQQAAVSYTDTIVTPINVNLDEQDVIKAHGKYYLIVSKLADTPSVASFDFKRYNVRELVSLP